MGDPLFSRIAYEPYLCRRAWIESEVERIGFFDDDLTSEQLGKVLNDKRWITPTEHLAPEGVVLCTTGAFSPLHDGHVAMLGMAKSHLEAKGIKMAGALIQPDHDQYVSSKPGAARCASERVHLAQELTKDIPWIAVDPWPSLYQDRALNYTTILRRTQRYLKRDVVYVFGSDNAGFEDAFLPHECVCVHRTAISSTQVRAKMEKLMWPEPSSEQPYLIRNDLEWATSDWRPSVDVLMDFHFALWNAFNTVWPHHSFRQVVPKYQQETVDQMTEPYINFDRVTGGRHWITRLFRPCTHQHKPVDWLMSPLKTIASGRYALIDDDIASGATAARIREATPQVEWTKQVSLTDMVCPGGFFDVVDARDFLFGSKLGGLGIKRGDFMTRAPYITPWVNLTQRAKIPPAKQPAFVKAIIEANVAFFERCPVTVEDTYDPRFWAWNGYDGKISMLDVAKDLLTWNPND